VRRVRGRLHDRAACPRRPDDRQADGRNSRSRWRRRGAVRRHGVPSAPGILPVGRLPHPRLRDGGAPCRQARPSRSDRRYPRRAATEARRGRARAAAPSGGDSGGLRRSVIPTAPLRVRNRLTEIILAALEDTGARRELTELTRADADAPGWLEKEERDYLRLVRERAQHASRALADRPACRIRSRAEAFDAAAALFDAHLYFEVHELLEPYWRDARGEDRESLQGVIQVAVGYQHLANGNLAGARALL